MARKPKHRTYPDPLSCEQALRAATPTLAEDVRQGRIDHFPPRGSKMVCCGRRDCDELLFPPYYVATWIDRRRCMHVVCDDCRNHLQLENAQAWERYERERADGTLDLEREDRGVEAPLDPRREKHRFRFLAARSRVLVCRMGLDRSVIPAPGGEDRGELEFATAVVFADDTSAQLPDPAPGPGPGTPKPRAAA